MSIKRQGTSMDWAFIAKTIHQGIVQLKQEDSCTDFVIEIGDKSFRCHKVVLASVSDYFKALFSSGMKETSQSKVVFEDINPSSVETILKFLYPEDRRNPLEGAEEADVSDLLKLAGRFQMKFLQDVSLKYFEKTMSVENCVARWKLGEQVLCEQLSELGFGFITEHFQEIASDNILVSLEFDDFHTVIKNESMYVKREDIVWSAIQSWVSFHKEKRGVFITDLLGECSLTEIDPDFLVEEIAFDPMVRQSDTASKLVQEAVKYKRHPGMHGDLELKFRDCHEKKQMAFLLLESSGQIESIAVNSSKAWSIDCETLASDTRRPSAGDLKISCCVHGDSVYMLKEERHRGSKLWVYHGSDDSWESLRSLDICLVGHTMCAADGYLHVIGGRSTLEMNAQVWRYNIESNSWDIVGEIMAPVISASSVCVNSNIYIFGGELENREPTDCVQVFDMKTKEGTIYCNLPKPCNWSRAIVRGKTVYVVTASGDVVKVSLESGESSILASIRSFDRINFGIFLRQGDLFICGGHEGKTSGDGESEAAPRIYGKEEFIVDVRSGKIKRSMWLSRAGYHKYCGVLASVLVVLNTTKLTNRYLEILQNDH